MKTCIAPAIVLLLMPIAAMAEISSKDMSQGMEAAHRNVRSQVNLQKLTWSEELARYAQEWANYLRDNKGCQMEHRPRTGPYTQKYGENLFWASPITWSNGKVELKRVTPDMVVQEWASEKANYNYTTNSCSGVCGHYTQIVWKSSKKVGCAMAVCSNKSQVWVCNYDPPGNISGQKPY